MTRTSHVIAFAFLLLGQPAGKADPQPTSATAHIISFSLLDGSLHEHIEQKPFDSFDLCNSWKYQRQFLAPPPPYFISFVYCEMTEIEARDHRPAVNVANSAP